MAQVIPQVIHRFWLGPDPIPEAFERYAESWRRLHPDWEIRLWRDETLPPLSCQSQVDRATDFRTKYDVVRLELLRQFGGVIIDMDMEAIRPIDPLLDRVEAFVGRVGRARRVGVQILGAVPNHPFFEHAVERLKDTVGVAPTPSQESGPGFLSRMVAERPDDVTVLPREAFFSSLTIEPPKRPQDFPEIYAVHHHTESYEPPGPESEIARLGRRLHEAQLEVHRLELSMAKLVTHTRKIAHKNEAANARIQKLQARIQKLEQRNEAFKAQIERTRFSDAAGGAQVGQLEARPTQLRAPRWWQLGMRLGIVQRFTRG